MKLLTSRYLKISGERNPDYTDKISVKQNIKIKSLEKYKTISSKEDSIKVIYNFEISYGDLGKIELEGLFILSMDSKTQKDLLKNYSDKKMNNTESIALMNLIIQRASIKALELEEELFLPIHIQLPSLKTKTE